MISKLLGGTQYEAFFASHLAEPAAAWQRPSEEVLEVTWRRFREAEDDR